MLGFSRLWPTFLLATAVFAREYDVLVDTGFFGDEAVGIPTDVVVYTLSTVATELFRPVLNYTCLFSTNYMN